MENIDQMKTEDFVQQVHSLGLFAEFTDYMADIDEDYAEVENAVRRMFLNKTDTLQDSYNRLCDYLNEYIGPCVPISEQEFLATSSRIRSLRTDMKAVSAILNRWGIEAYDVCGDLWEEFELRPLQSWVERIVEQVRASQLKAA